MNYEAPSKSDNINQIYKKEFPKISIKNFLLTLAGAMITISISYMAYSKYRENQFTQELMKTTFGVNNEEEFIEMQKNMQQKMIESFQNINENFKKNIHQ